MILRPVDLLATRRMQHAGWKELLFPLVPAAVLALGLIVAEPDLGQTVSVSIVLLGLHPCMPSGTTKPERAQALQRG